MQMRFLLLPHVLILFPEGPGAYDNMAGAGMRLEVCPLLKRASARGENFRLEFVWFSTEEKGLLGSRHYIKMHEHELGKHRFNMNVDIGRTACGRQCDWRDS